MKTFYQKQIYELIQRDLQCLSAKNSYLSQIVEANQQGLHIYSLKISNFNKKAYYYKQLLPIVANVVKKLVYLIILLVIHR